MANNSVDILLKTTNVNYMVAFEEKSKDNKKLSSTVNVCKPFLDNS